MVLQDEKDHESCMSSVISTLTFLSLLQDLSQQDDLLSFLKLLIIISNLLLVEVQTVQKVLIDLIEFVVEFVEYVIEGVMLVLMFIITIILFIWRFHFITVISILLLTAFIIINQIVVQVNLWLLMQVGIVIRIIVTILKVDLPLIIPEEIVALNQFIEHHLAVDLLTFLIITELGLQIAILEPSLLS